MAKKVNKSQAVRDYLKAHPAAKSTEIATALKKQGIKITPGHVATIKTKIKAKRRARKAAAKPAPVAASPVPAPAPAAVGKAGEGRRHHHHQPTEGGQPDSSGRGRRWPGKRPAGARQGSWWCEEVQGPTGRDVRGGQPLTVVCLPLIATVVQWLSVRIPSLASACSLERNLPPLSQLVPCPRRQHPGCSKRLKASGQVGLLRCSL
jgi:hypothetical protein